MGSVSTKRVAAVLVSRRNFDCQRLGSIPGITVDNGAVRQAVGQSVGVRDVLVDADVSCEVLAATVLNERKR